MSVCAAPVAGPAGAPAEAVPGVEILRRLSDGDPTSWEAVITQYQGVVRRAGCNLGLTAEEREDAVQDVWLRLLEHACEVRDYRALPGWLRTTARRECVDLRRRRRHELPLSEAGAERVQSEEPPAADLMIAEERRLALREAVRRLRPRDRDLVRLLLSGRPYSEISAAANMPVGSIGPTRARVLTRLRHTLAPRETEQAAVSA